MPQTLEHRAIEAHHAGVAWHEYWESHVDLIRESEPDDEQAFDRLVKRLMHLLITGDESGQFPPADPDEIKSWNRDGAAEQPNETTTRARLQTAFPLAVEAPQ